MLDLSEIRAVTDKATPGPWILEGDCGYIRSRPTPDANITIPDKLTICMVKQYKDAPFICGSRQWVPALCDEVEVGRAALIKKEEQNLSLQNIHDMDKGRIDDLKKQVQAALGTANMWTDAEEKRREETAVLHRALEMACERMGDLDWCLIPCEGISCTKSCKKCLKKYFIERAREEMEK